MVTVGKTNVVTTCKLARYNSSKTLAMCLTDDGGLSSSYRHIPCRSLRRFLTVDLKRVTANWGSTVGRPALVRTSASVPPPDHACPLSTMILS